MTAYELYCERRPDRIDELQCMGIDLFLEDGEVNWNYIVLNLPDDRYDELLCMGVFRELRDIEDELRESTPNRTIGFDSPEFSKRFEELLGE